MIPGRTWSLTFPYSLIGVFSWRQEEVSPKEATVFGLNHWQLGVSLFCFPLRFFLSETRDPTLELLGYRLKEVSFGSMELEAYN